MVPLKRRQAIKRGDLDASIEAGNGRAATEWLVTNLPGSCRSGQRRPLARVLSDFSATSPEATKLIDPMLRELASAPVNLECVRKLAAICKVADCAAEVDWMDLADMLETWPSRASELWSAPRRVGPPLRADEPSTSVLRFRVTAAEKSAIEQATTAGGHRSVSAYIRSLAVPG